MGPPPRGPRGEGHGAQLEGGAHGAQEMGEILRKSEKVFLITVTVLKENNVHF